jgi:hypothetical protein
MAKVMIHGNLHRISTAQRRSRSMKIAKESDKIRIKRIKGV